MWLTSRLSDQTTCNLQILEIIIINTYHNDRSPRDKSLTDLLFKKTKQKQNLKTALIFQRSRATAVNCFPFDVIVFVMLPAQGIWRETVSLLDVM